MGEPNQSSAVEPRFWWWKTDVHTQCTLQCFMSNRLSSILRTKYSTALRAGHVCSWKVSCGLAWTEPSLRDTNPNQRAVWQMQITGWSNWKACVLFEPDEKGMYAPRVTAVTRKSQDAPCLDWATTLRYLTQFEYRTQRWKSKLCWWLAGEEASFH